MANDSLLKGLQTRFKSNGQTKGPKIIAPAKSYINTTQTTLRNKPYEGFTENMLAYLASNPLHISSQANWVNLSTSNYLQLAYLSNPVVNAVINILADAWANMKYKVRILKDDEIIALEDYDADGGKLKSLLLKPNPRESGFEWIKANRVNYGVFGNSFVYASVPIGAEIVGFDYQMISVLNNLPPANLKTVITGAWLEATEMDEIVKHYELTNIDSSITEIATNKVWHTNTNNIRLDENFTLGRSKLVALRDPISNIAGAYETRNVMIYKRGAIGFLSSEKAADGTGSIALDDREIDQVQKRMEIYGTMRDQYEHMILPLPMKYVRMAMSIKDLMVFEEIESDAVAISNAYGVPELLVKYYVKGATFENIATSERQLYDRTVIPDSKDFMFGLNNFFKTEESGIELLASFDHVAALQQNKKEESEVNSKNAETMRKAFFSGAVIYNDYLAALNLPDDPTIGLLRIWDLTPEQLLAIDAGKSPTQTTNTNSDGNEPD